MYTRGRLGPDVMRNILSYDNPMPIYILRITVQWSC